MPWHPKIGFFSPPPAMIRSIIESSMRWRTIVVAVAALIMFIGLSELDDITVEVFPEMAPPTVEVQTEALGLSAVEVEQLITVPLEADLLVGVPWLEVMRSESVPGLSSIQMTFQPGTDLMKARQVVQERLTGAHALPNVSKPPQMLQPLSSANRVMMIGVTSKDLSLIEMSVLARWTIQPRLMSVPGVANVAIWGQRERQLQVQVDPARLKEQHLSLIQIIKTAGNALWLSPLSFLESSVAGTGGFIETPNQRLGLRHLLPISTAADLAKVPVEDAGVRLGEVATVIEDHQPLIGDAMTGQGPGLIFVVEKFPGANTLEVSDDVDEAIEALKPGLAGMQFDTSLYRPARYIQSAIDNVARAVIVGLVLVAVALLALFYDWRAALVGLVSILLSLLAAVLVIQATGSTFNAMSLAGLVIALGIVIDDAVINADNVLRRMRKEAGEPIARSILRSILEASLATRRPLVFATVIVLLAALPALLTEGVPGAFVRPMVVSYVLAILASMVVALTISPALSLILLRRAPLECRPSPLGAWLQRRCDPLVRASMAAPRAMFAVLAVAALACLALLPRFGASPLPTFSESDLLIEMDGPPGTSRQEMNRILDRVARELRLVPGVRKVGAHVGRAIMSDQVVGINSSELWLSIDPTADRAKTVAAVEEIVHGYPGFDGDVLTFLNSRFGEVLAGIDEPIVVRVYGQELDVLRREAEQLKQAIAGIDGIVNPRVEMDPEEPVVEIKVDLAAAQKYGIKPGDVRRAAATLVAGIEVGNLFEEQKVFQVVVWGTPQVRNDLDAIRNLLIDAPGGSHVRLGDVASVQIVPAPNVIRRENVARHLDVVAEVSGRSVDAVVGDVHRQIQASKFPLEYRAELVGDFARQQASSKRVMVVVIAAAIGIALVLQASFGIWSLALVVFLTLPMALAGGVFAALLTDGTFYLGSLAGFLTVLAITVRQAIMLISDYQKFRSQEGATFGPELVLRGIRDRTAPILITAIVTALAVLPFLVFGNLPGLEILRPMAVVILGSLVTSTLYMLCMVPALYLRFGASAIADEMLDEESLDAGRGITLRDSPATP
jgi:CzcA family heavy metal efflux pump